MRATSGGRRSGTGESAMSRAQGTSPDPSPGPSPGGVARDPLRGSPPRSEEAIEQVPAAGVEPADVVDPKVDAVAVRDQQGARPQTPDILLEIGRASCRETASSARLAA